MDNWVLVLKKLAVWDRFGDEHSAGTVGVNSPLFMDFFEESGSALCGALDDGYTHEFV